MSFFEEEMYQEIDDDMITFARNLPRREYTGGNFDDEFSQDDIDMFCDIALALLGPTYLLEDRVFAEDLPSEFTTDQDYIPEIGIFFMLNGHLSPHNYPFYSYTDNSATIMYPFANGFYIENYKQDEHLYDYL